MITLEQLRIFVAVAEREHLTQAANVLRLTPSALSTSIHNLEDNFNLALFYRVGRQIKLSEAGKVFLEEAKATLQRAAMSERILEELSGLSRGSLILYASQTIANYWLPPILSVFNDEYPAVTIDLTIVNSDKVARAVQEGICDIGFIETDLRFSGIQRDHIMNDQLLVVTSPRLASEINIKFDRKTKDINYQLYDLSWIMREEGSGTRSSFYQAIEAAGLDASKIQVKFTLPSNEAVLSAVLSGNYAAPLSRFVVQHYIIFEVGKHKMTAIKNLTRGSITVEYNKKCVTFSGEMYFPEEGRLGFFVYSNIPNHWDAPDDNKVITDQEHIILRDILECQFIGKFSEIVFE